ncbi:MAG: hypothetical protein EOP38_24095 [Rubrivivax sp.]|nr:MAG: hypothetical protein EOP38_24095 [Rubrivivax sp.]
MAILDLINPRRVAVASGADHFHRMMARVKEASFADRLPDVDPTAAPEDAEDVTDYMLIVGVITRCLGEMEAHSSDHREGFMRAMAHVLSASVSGYSHNENFDVFAETGRAYELRTEPHPGAADTATAR